MEDFKTKFLDLINKQNRQTKIPAMGFTDYYMTTPETPVDKRPKKHTEEEDDRMSDQEILEGIQDIYYEENADTSTYELKKCAESDFDCDSIQKAIAILKQQQKVISKKVLQHILEQRSACNEEFEKISNTEKDLQESLWVCRKARSYLNYAKKNLTTTSLEILATYRKREIMFELLKSLNSIKTMKSTDIQLQKLLNEGNYSGAISILLECKATASQYPQYNCVESLNQKLQETLMLTEIQLEGVLNDMTQNFDVKKYGKLQEAYKLLNKSLYAMDQLHINFISAIHSTVNSVLRNYNDQSADDNQKQLFEQLCEKVPADKYIPCVIDLCKSFWALLASYYQIVMWHSNFKLFPNETDDDSNPDVYIQEKLKKGQSRIWNDIQSKLCTYLSSAKSITLKYEQFIQVLSIVQRLKKVGMEFCGETSEKLLETMRLQSIQFFNRYHLSCLDEICLFLDNEAWVSVNSFSNILQLQEFRSVKHSLQRHSSPPIEPKAAISASEKSGNNDILSVRSQDESSIYESCGYFVRFSEKSSPFDGGLDATMLEEDILSGIVDEASCYFSEESEEDDAKQSFLKRSLDENGDEVDSSSNILANNTSLNVLRCIGRYLQMCKLLHSISPQIVSSMFELIDFYVFAVHEIFGKDSEAKRVVPMDNLYSSLLEKKLSYVRDDIAPKIHGWPPNFTSIMNNELNNPETLFGLGQRIVGIESGVCISKQFDQLRSYLEHLLPNNEKQKLTEYFQNIHFVQDAAKPIYLCVTSRVLDLQGILNAMSKVKWDVNHVSVQHSSYIDILNRSIQTFAMRIEEISKQLPVPFESLWNSLAHVSTHLLVEGFSNAKKCSAGGRQIMQLDFTHFMSILELISGLKFVEHRIYVDSYVKAYYFPSELFEDWIKEHKDRTEYSTKQLTNLISCVCANDKRTRQKLLALVENLSNESS